MMEGVCRVTVPKCDIFSEEPARDGSDFFRNRPLPRIMGIVGSYVMWTLPRGDEHIKGVQRIPVLLEFCSEWHHNPPPSTVDPGQL